MPYFLGSIWQRIILFHTQTRINQIEIFQTNDKSSRYRENGYMCSRVALKRQLIVIASWMRQIFGDAVFLTHFPLISTHIFKQNSKIVFLLQKQCTKEPHWINNFLLGNKFQLITFLFTVQTKHLDYFRNQTPNIFEI